MKSVSIALPPHAAQPALRPHAAQPALPSHAAQPAARESQLQLDAAPSRQRRKEARPLELLDAALGLFVERGFATTRSEDVAARAGVSKGTLYLYYPSKEELLKAVIRHHVVNPIAEGMDVIRQFEGSSADLLALMLRLWWERIGETPAAGILKLMMAEGRNFPEIAQFYVDEVIDPSNAMMGRMVQRGIDSGEFRPVDVRNVVGVMCGTLVFMAVNKHSLGGCAPVIPLEPKAVIEAQIDLVLRGLQTTQPAPQTRQTRRTAAPDTARKGKE